MVSAETIHRTLDDLPPDLRREAIHYIEELAKRQKKPKKKKFRLNWAGGLAHLRNSTTSVELQHAANEWRD
jgi:NADPH-dependent ferric siderophore reductase